MRFFGKFNQKGDVRPRTVVWHDEFGIGDLIWHLPFFEAIARHSFGGKVAVIVSPTTCARQILGELPWVEEIIDFERRRQRAGTFTATHVGKAGLLCFAKELRAKKFARVILFSHSTTLAAVAWYARIPQRLSYGVAPEQRIWLNCPPYIAKYSGSAVPVYHEALALTMAHGFCTEALAPRVTIADTVLAHARERLSDLPRPLFALGIGTSDPIKQWGGLRYLQLAKLLTTAGAGVLIVGGRQEEALGLDILRCLPPHLQSQVRVWCRETIMGSAAALKVCDVSIGNDTGAANLAAACERPSYVVLGARPHLDHDPLMRMLSAESLEAIEPEHVVERLRADGLLASMLTPATD